MNPCFLQGCKRDEYRDSVAGLVAGLLDVAHDEHVSPHMQRRILQTLVDHGVWSGDVDAVVDAHPNFNQPEEAATCSTP